MPCAPTRLPAPKARLPGRAANINKKKVPSKADRPKYELGTGQNKLAKLVAKPGWYPNSPATPRTLLGAGPNYPRACLAKNPKASSCWEKKQWATNNFVQSSCLAHCLLPFLHWQGPMRFVQDLLEWLIRSQTRRKKYSYWASFRPAM